MIRTVIFYTVVIPYSFICIGLALAVGMVPGGRPVMHWIDRSLWPNGWMRLCGIPVHCTGSTERLVPNKAYVFVSNHQSHFDIPATKVALSDRMLFFVTKRSLIYIPLVGFYLWRSGYPLIDRSRKNQSMKTMQLAARDVREGSSILVYPEGTRTFDGQIGAFKSGAFILAIESQTPIVPITITGSMGVMHRSRSIIKGGSIRVHIGDAIPTTGLTLSDRHMLLDTVRSVILSQYETQRTERGTFIL